MEPSALVARLSYYVGLDGQCMPRLQKALTAALSREIKRTFLLSCGEDVAIHISSCALPGTLDWVNDVQSALSL